jgi:hypothetical protein
MQGPMGPMGPGVANGTLVAVDATGKVLGPYAGSLFDTNTGFYIALPEAPAVFVYMPSAQYLPTSSPFLYFESIDCSGPPFMYFGGSANFNGFSTSWVQNDRLYYSARERTSGFVLRSYLTRPAGWPTVPASGCGPVYDQGGFSSPVLSVPLSEVGLEPIYPEIR